jgi:hypothetical protein
MVATKYKEVAGSYGITDLSIPVLPSYPRDLSKFVKPSIIIQKVDTKKSNICFGGFIGQYTDDDTDTTMDVSSINNAMTLQINIDADSNTQCSLFSSIVSEDILMGIRISDGGEFPLYDYIVDSKHPTLMGKCKIIGDIDVANLSGNENNDYINFIRIDISTLQVIVPNQEFVNLGKGIKYTQTIKL